MRSFNFIGIPVAVTVSACTTLPLPDDVVKLTTYQIAHKIRCEAKEAVQHLFQKEQLANGKEIYDNRIKNLKKEQ